MVLQNIDKSSTRIENNEADILHCIFANLLWLSKRGRPDVEPDISFLCTRVTKSTNEDKAKLRRVLQYLKQTIDDKTIVGADSLSQLFPWFHDAYGVHPDLKIHTGGCMSFGYGTVHCKSSKQTPKKKSPLRLK